VRYAQGLATALSHPVVPSLRASLRRGWCPGQAVAFGALRAPWACAGTRANPGLGNPFRKGWGFCGCGFWVGVVGGCCWGVAGWFVGRVVGVLGGWFVFGSYSFLCDDNNTAPCAGRRVGVGPELGGFVMPLVGWWMGAVTKE